MTSYLEEKLKSMEQSKIELEKEQLKIQKQLELELEKVRVLELDGTVDKLKLQVDELSENISGKIMPNNLHLVHDQMQKDFRKDLDKFMELKQSRKLSATELETKRLSLRQREIDMRKETKYNKRRRVNGFMELLDNEKFITLEKFKDNLSKIDDETKNHFMSGSYARKHLVEIKPEIKIYDELIPIFRTLTGIIIKQQQEIDILKTKLL